MDVKDALFELLEDTGNETTGIRTGEKLNEVLINEYEIPFSWEVDQMYMILNPTLNKKSVDDLSKIYNNIKKIDQKENYSSNNAEKIPKDELMKIIKDAGLL